MSTSIEAEEFLKKAHSHVAKDYLSKTSKEKFQIIIWKVSYQKVGIKGSRTLKTVHRYDFLFPSYGQLKRDQCSPPEL